MKKLNLVFVWLAILGLLVWARSGRALTGDEVMQRANHVAYYQGDDMRARVEMRITDSQGRKRMRKLIMLRKDVEDDKEQKFYVYFLEPPDIEGMVYMVWKHLGRDDDRWLYLPGLDLVKRIAASDKRSSFVGSDFVYEDISGRSLDEDVHELIGEEGEYFVVKNTPKKPDTVEFSYYKVWVRKDNYLPTKIEYYDKSGKLYKTIEVLEFKDIQGYPTVTRAKATNHEAGSNTELVYEKVEYNLGIGDDIFTERYLRRPPRKWIR